MQTAKLVYLIMWVLMAVPLIGFNIKRMYVKKFGEKRRIKIPFVLFIAALAAFISVFLFYAYKVTVDTRYELAAERYIDLHAEYATGRLTYDEYEKLSAGLQTDGADTQAFADELRASAGDADSVRFQIGDWITPKYYEDDEAFPKTTVIDKENPVFLMYRFEEGSEQAFYLIEMVWSDGGWKIAYHAPATDEQYESAKKTLPSEINGQWFTVKS